MILRNLKSLIRRYPVAVVLNFTGLVAALLLEEKVSLHPLYFIGGALLVLTIVLGVVVLNCLRIARANPVESLKAE